MILDQLVEPTGWHRDYARSALREAGTVRVAGSRKARPPIYSSRVVVGLEQNWTHLRSLVGYLRYDSPVEPKLLNEIWAVD